MCAALFMALAYPTIDAADEEPSRTDALRSDASSSPVGGEFQVAQAGTDESMMTSGSFEEPASGQSIQMDLAEPEDDVLTRAAIEKLDAEIGSLTFKDTDLSDVIRFIGRKLDLNFIFDSDVVKGKVTLTFRNVRVRDALDSILTAQKLALVPDDSGIFRIVPADRVGGQEVETRTEVIELKWVNAADVKRTMQPFLSPHGKMELNEESNVLIITDVPPNLVNIKELIGKIDKAERQVMIEARLIDVNVGALRNLGVSWTASQANKASAKEPGAPNVDVLGVANVLYEGLGYSSGVGSLALGDRVGLFGQDYNINFVMDAFESRDIVEVLANPRVTTLNNVPALISIIEKIPYQEAVQGPSQSAVTIEVEFERAGVDITVRPIITPDDFVRMEINLAQMIFRERVGTEPLAPPRIDERKADTNVIVKSGNTVVLGGLRQIRKLEGTRAVPWLHQVPLFGWLFKNKNHDQQKTELVLMMTPTVIKDAVSLTDREKELYNRLDSQWHLPDRWFDDVAPPEFENTRRAMK
jgi:type IV pilus assembly protein PilQ